MQVHSPRDIYGYRARIGYTSPPAATEVFPFEFYKMVNGFWKMLCQREPVTFYVSQFAWQRPVHIRNREALRYL